MPFNIVLSDAAAFYGIADQSSALDTGLDSLLGTIGSVTTSWGTGQLAVGQSGTITMVYSHGFSLALTFTETSSTQATVSESDVLSPTGVKLLSYGGGNLAVSASTLTQDLTDANALAGNDTITGNSSDNVLEGYGGDDTIDGGAGTDTVVERGNLAAYTVQNNGASITIKGLDGTDTVTNVERVQFDDYSLAFDTSGIPGEAYRLYQAALDRAPDSGGLGFYIHTLEVGWTLHDIAGDFLNSPEFQQTYGNTTDLQFIDLLYENVLHRQGEASGVAFHLNELAQGLDRAQVLVNFSESPENQAALIGVMSQGMKYLPQH